MLTRSAKRPLDEPPALLLEGPRKARKLFQDGMRELEAYVSQEAKRLEDRDATLRTQVQSARNEIDTMERLHQQQLEALRLQTEHEKAKSQQLCEELDQLQAQMEKIRSLTQAPSAGVSDDAP